MFYNSFHIHDFKNKITFSLEYVSFCMTNKCLLSLLLKNCKLFYFMGYICLNCNGYTVLCSQVLDLAQVEFGLHLAHTIDIVYVSN
jgi:hypothetical protein